MMGGGRRGQTLNFLGLCFSPMRPQSALPRQRMTPQSRLTWRCPWLG